MMIKELKQPYKELALKRLKEGDWVDETTPYPENWTLFNAFDWSKSPEGHDFWEQVNDGHYPSIPEKSIKDSEYSLPYSDEGDSEGITSWNHPESEKHWDVYYKGELIEEDSLFPEETITDHMNEKLGRKIKDYRVAVRDTTIKKVGRYKTTYYETIIQD